MDSQSGQADMQRFAESHKEEFTGEFLARSRNTFTYFSYCILKNTYCNNVDIVLHYGIARPSQKFVYILSSRQINSEKISSKNKTNCEENVQSSIKFLPKFEHILRKFKDNFRKILVIINSNYD